MSRDGQSKYSTNKLVWSKKIFELELTSAQKIVLAVLATFADRHGGRVYPSIATLADRTSLAARTVRRSLKVLREQNFIIPTGQTAAKVVMYRINIDAIMGGDTVSGGEDTVSPNQFINQGHEQAIDADTQDFKDFMSHAERPCPTLIEKERYRRSRGKLWFSV